MPTPPASATSVRHASQWHLVRRLLQLSWRYRGGCVRLLALQVCLVCLGVAALNLGGLGFDVIRAGVLHTAAPPHWLVPRAVAAWTPMHQLQLIGGAILAIAVLRGGLSFVYTNAATQLVQGKIVVDLRTQVYQRLQQLPFRFYDANTSGSIINRVTSDVQSVRAFVDGVLLQGVILLLSLVLYLANMLALSPSLTLLCLSTVPVLWLATVVFSRLVRPEYQRNRELYDQMILSYTESIQGVQVSKGFAREAERAAVFARANAQVRDQQGRIFWRVSLFSPMVDMLPQLSVVVLLVYGGAQVLDDRLPLGVGLMVFIGLQMQFSAQISAIANISNTAQQSLVAAGRVFEVLDAPVEVASPAAPVRPSRLAGRVTFDRVRFHYTADEPVLEDLDFDIPAGSCVAILGPTGAGKSTLLSLIPRFYDPTAGRVLIDGLDLRHLDLTQLRRSIGIVFQESFLFSNTIAANIAFGDPTASLERIVKAARIAQAHDFISALPDGYQTVLGESGISLSGGQRQRLAIARAILLEPPLLLLDDPTAAIDAETEHEILSALDAAIDGRTTFIVAHRLSTLRRADHILVVDGGRIIERGSHDQLLVAGGHYARAARLQLHEEAGPGMAARSGA